MILKQKKEQMKPKKKLDKGRIFTQIMAGILAAMMVLAFAGTLVFYLLNS